MEFTQPSNGQSFDIQETVHFIGTAESGIVRITMQADDRFDLPDATLTEEDSDGTHTWILNQRFLGTGARKITATGRDSADAVVSSANCRIKIAPPHVGAYNPPLASLGVLGDVVRHLEDVRTKRVLRNFEGGTALFDLPGGELYMDSDLDLDTDGSIFSEGDAHRGDTSLQNGDSGIDANAIPFYVLPLGSFTGNRGISLGDVGVVIREKKAVIALFADFGPRTKVGEGSIELHRRLGFERIKPNGKVIDVGIDAPVVTIVFPGSGQEWTSGINLKFPIADVMEKAEAKGKELFLALGGSM